MLRSYRTTDINVTGVPVPVQTCFLGPRPPGDVSSAAARESTPILLVHGFDSSAVEWRRIFPQLAADTDTYALDLFGAGFTDVSMYQQRPDIPLGPEQVCSQLSRFWQTHIQRPCVIVGASLGGTIAMDFALRHPGAVQKVVLIDAQGYIDGIGPAAKGPRWLAALGVRFLRTVFLRQIANKMAYHDVEKYATNDAMRIGRLHTFKAGWLEAKVAFIMSGGYKGLADRVRDIAQPCLLLWGKQDKILDVKYVKEFERDLQRVQTRLIDDCGHVAHLEQSTTCAHEILKFAAVQHTDTAEASKEVAMT